MTNSQDNLEPTGAIAIIYRQTDEGREFLLVQQKSGNLSVAGGGKENIDHDIDDTIVREIGEELNLTKDQYSIQELDFVHEFIYGPWKKERAGQLAKNKVYLLKVKPNVKIVPNLEEIVGAFWVKEEEVFKRLTLEDLKEIFKKAIAKINE